MKLSNLKNTYPELANALQRWIDEVGFDTVSETEEFQEALRNNIEPLRQKLLSLVQYKTNQFDSDEEYDDEDFDLTETEEISDDPGTNHLWKLVLFFEKDGQTERALRAAQEVLNREPHNPTVWYKVYSFYHFYAREEDVRHILDQIEQIYEEDELNVDYLFELSEIFSDAQDSSIGEFHEWSSEKFIYYYKRLLQRIEDLPDNYEILNRLYSFQSTIDIDEAFKTLEKIAKLKESDIEDLISICGIYLQKGDYKKAYFYFLQAQLRDPQHPQVLYKEQMTFGSVGLKKGLRDAVQKFQENTHYPHEKRKNKWPKDFPNNN